MRPLRTTRRCLTAVAGFFVSITLTWAVAGHADADRRADARGTDANRRADTGTTPSAGAPKRPPQVSARLVAASTVAPPGTPVPVGVALSIAPGWHIYWLNPGDAGIPTRVEWTPSKVVRLEPVQWPAPARFKEQEDFEALGYAGDVVLPSQATVSPGTTGEAVLEGTVSWLACKNDCVKGSAPLRLALPTRGTPADTADAARIREALARVPRSPSPTDPFRLELTAPATLASGAAGAVVVTLEPAARATAAGAGGAARGTDTTGSAAAGVGGAARGTHTAGAATEGGDLELEAVYLNADLAVTVGHEERLSPRSIRLAVRLPEGAEPAPGAALADGLVAQVKTLQDGKPVTTYLWLQVPTRVANAARP